MKKLIIVGAGGAGIEALWVAHRMNASAREPIWKIAGFIDDNPELAGTSIENVPVIGTVAQFMKESALGECSFHCAIGNNRQRQRVALILEAANAIPATLVDPTSVIADTSSLGGGSYVGPYSVLAPHSRVGRHVLINSQVGVGHHAQVGDFAQLCPGARLNGGCRLDTGAFLGSNAAIHPGIIIGEGASIGANSYVIRSVKPRFVMMGVPARIVSRPDENGPNAQGG
jgi:sugar O-acyltransferase (sialic acid O-acetyltransferase NeuD family)